MGESAIQSTERQFSCKPAVTTARSNRQPPVHRDLATVVSSKGQLALQRKPTCSCGGGCPSCRELSRHHNIQAKLAISRTGDLYERGANCADEQVPGCAVASGPASVPLIVQNVLRTPGQSLDAAKPAPTLEHASDRIFLLSASMLMAKPPNLPGPSMLTPTRLEMTSRLEPVSTSLSLLSAAACSRTN